MRKEDWCLQVLEWGGRFFLETRLIFGSRSSPGIYDELHKCFLYSVVGLTPGFTREDVEQHLDDVLGVGPPVANGEASVDKFFENYRKEAEKVGFRLDKSGNRDKVQPPDTKCTALGVEIDTMAWTWRYKADKLARILHTLAGMARGEELQYSELQSIVGKLIDVLFLVRGGRYNMLYFLLAVNKEVPKAQMVKPTTELREQAGWWMVALVGADRRSPIIHPDPKVPSNAVEGWTDAAGGTTSHQGAGVGGLIPPFYYFYLPWPAWLNWRQANTDGEVFASKLTCLELLGALVLLVTCGEVAAGAHLKIYVDNQGAVDVYGKGHSTKCLYTSTVAKAMYEVAEAIGVTVTVAKVRRGSDRGSYTADMISKGNLREVKRMMPLRRAPMEVPPSVEGWLKDPRVDMAWSKLLLSDMAARGVEVITPY